MARRKQNFDRDVKALITKITGIVEEEENFDVCLQFVQSNFKFHKFLAVNSHQLEKRLEGVHHKFLVHSQHKKAAAFHQLRTTFLESPVFEHNEKGHTDTHYAILSLLLDLSQAPTATDYVQTETEIQQDDTSDFDWATYLLEGEEFEYQGGESSDEWSSSEDEHDGKSTTKLNVDFPPSTHAVSMARLSDTQDPSLTGSGRWSDVSLTGSNKPGLDRQVVTPYWTGQREPLTSSSQGTCNLRADWEHYLSCCDPLYVSMDQYQMKEHQIVREVLWMLLGSRELFLYRWSEGSYVMREGIGVTHLTGGSLQSFLSQLAVYGNIVRKLKEFVETVCNSLHNYTPETSTQTTHTCAARSGASDTMHESLSSKTHSNTDGSHTVNDSTLIYLPEAGLASQSSSVISVDDLTHLWGHGACQTYQAFASSLSRYLQDFNHELLVLERQMDKTEETLTLSVLTKKLSQRFDQLSLLGQVYTRGVEAFRGVTSNVDRASGLLSALYEALIDSDTQGLDKIDMVSLLLPMWLRTVKPYLDITGQWLADGHLIDPYREFIVQRNKKKNEALDETFWDTAFTVHCFKTLTTPDQSDQTSSAPNQTSSAPNQTSDPGDPPAALSDSFHTSQNTPDFLAPVLEPIILAGKSMEMMENLGRLEEAVEKTDGKRKSLYETFLSSLESLVGETGGSGLESGGDDIPPPDSVFSSHIAHQMEVRGVRDPLLRLNFAAIFNPTTLRPGSLTTEDKDLDRTVAGLSLYSLCPIQLVLERCLYPHITDQYTRVCGQLLRTLTVDFSLMQYFTSIRNFFLMEAGDAMHDFCLELFEKLRLQEPWQDVSFLNIALQDSLQPHHPGESERLSVGVEQPSTRPTHTHPVSALDTLRMYYKVPWPVDVILNSRSMEAYNRVFAFLLQIKRVKYCLDELRFPDLEKEEATSLSDDPLSLSPKRSEPRSQMLHRIQIFRMRLMHFVNNIHNYIMTRILHTTGLEFQREMSEARDLDQVIAIHHAYVTRLYNRCLLDRKVAYLREAISKVFNTALDFAQLWQAGVGGVSGDALSDLEADFSKCVLFLSSCLRNVVKKGSFPHLESLAFTLSSSEVTPRE